MSDLSDLLCIEDSGSSPAPAAALPPVEDDEDALPPAALEPLAELPGQLQLAEGSDDDAEPPADALPPAVDPEEMLGDELAPEVED